MPLRKKSPGPAGSEMIEDTVKIVNEAQKDKVQVNLIINNRAGGNAPLIAEKLVERLHKKTAGAVLNRLIRVRTRHAKRRKSL
jgi:uncharacterized protein YecE (DUF72 family)